MVCNCIGVKEEDARVRISKEYPQDAKVIARAVGAAHRVSNLEDRRVWMPVDAIVKYLNSSGKPEVRERRVYVFPTYCPFCGVKHNPDKSDEVAA